MVRPDYCAVDHLQAGVRPAPPPISTTRRNIQGSWGLEGCKRRGEFRVEGDWLKQDWGNFRSEGLIEAEGENMLMVRDRKSGEVYSLTITGRRLAMKKAAEGAETPLVRCG